MCRWSVMARRVSPKSTRKRFALFLACGGICILLMAGQIETPESLNIKIYNLSQSSLLNYIKKRVEGHVALRIATLANTFVASKTTNGIQEKEDDNLLVLTFRLRSNAHTGVRLVSVRDPITGRSCTFTSDNRQILQSDVVIIPGRAMHMDMASYRAPHQRWVFYSSESFHYVSPVLKYKFAFNHTMTYHQHADIDTSRLGSCNSNQTKS